MVFWLNEFCPLWEKAYKSRYHILNHTKNVWILFKDITCLRHIMNKSSTKIHLILRMLDVRERLENMKSECKAKLDYDLHKQVHRKIASFGITCGL